MATFNLSPLAYHELREIKTAAYRILDKTGLLVKHKYVLEKLADIGCNVDFENMLVKFPTKIVDEQLVKIPTTFYLGGRDPDIKYQMRENTMFTRPQSGCPNVLALENGAFGPATQEDVVNITRLIDGLEHVDFCASLLYPWDVPSAVRDVRALQIIFQHTNKHVYIQPYNGHSTKAMIQMAEILRGGMKELADYSPMTFIVSPTTPLKYSPNELEVLIEIARVGLPVMVGSTPIAGATSPVTIAGQILLQHVENLAGLVILQALRPGCPVTYAARPSFMEMRGGNTTWGNIEWGMATATIAQLTRSCNLLLDVVGLPSDSRAVDIQSAIEKAMNAVLTGVCSPNVFAGVGIIETIMTGSFEQVVIDNEICGMVKRIRRGIDISKDHLAEDLINDVGAFGNYLAEQHTLDYFRTETYSPVLFDTSRRIDWEQAGSKSIWQQAKASAKRIMEEHESQRLSEAQSKEMESIFQSMVEGH
jgi:trimethylamine--corrinoid protein Co-methyltransferase